MHTILKWVFRASIAGFVFLASCGFKKTDAGVEYKFIKDEEGNNLELGGGMEMIVNYYNEADTFNCMKDMGGPAKIGLQDSVPPFSLQSVLLLLSKGDSVQIRMPSDSAYKSLGMPMPKDLDEDSKTIFEIKVLNVITKDSIRKMQEAYAAEQRKAQEQMMMQYQQDTLQILDFLKKKGIKAKRTPDGVYYTITKKQEGITLQPGDTANTFYAGKLLDGKQFDSNFGKNPFPVVVGQSQVINGWHSALMAMKKGEKATFYIPSVLAYGPQGAGNDIPPNSVLIFDIEVQK